MRNKSKLAVLLLIFLTLFAFSCKKNETYDVSVEDISLAEVLVKSKIVIGVSAYNPPMSFYNSKKELDGFDIDVFKEIADVMNIEAEFQTVNTGEVLQLITNGDIDCIASGFSYSDERTKYYEMTQPYLRNAVVLVTLKQKELKNLEDLKGKKIGGQKGSLGISVIKNNPELTAKIAYVRDTYNNITEVLGDLKNLGIDAGVADLSAIIEYLANEPDVYKIFGDALAMDYYVYAFKKRSLALKNEVEKNLLKLEQQGTLEKISRKWFGADRIILGK